MLLAHGLYTKYHEDILGKKASYGIKRGTPLTCESIEAALANRKIG